MQPKVRGCARNSILYSLFSLLVSIATIVYATGSWIQNCNTVAQLPSDMNLKIRSGTVGYNNKIFMSDGKFSLGKNNKVNSLVLEPVIPMPKGHPSHKALAHTHESSQKPTHEDEKIVFVLFLAGGFIICNIFQ